jgi:hypothetical protein
MRALARSVGVSDPARVRIVVVDHVPFPDEPMLKAAAESLGFTQTNITGLTLGHAIFVRRGRDRDPLLLSHELRHVAQYEAEGGIAPFLAQHLVDLVEHGYEGLALRSGRPRARARDISPGPFVETGATAPVPRFDRACDSAARLSDLVHRDRRSRRLRELRIALLAAEVVGHVPVLRSPRTSWQRCTSRDV